MSIPATSLSWDRQQGREHNQELIWSNYPISVRPKQCSRMITPMYLSFVTYTPAAATDEDGLRQCEYQAPTGTVQEPRSDHWQNRCCLLSKDCLMDTTLDNNLIFVRSPQLVPGNNPHSPPHDRYRRLCNAVSHQRAQPSRRAQELLPHLVW